MRTDDWQPPYTSWTFDLNNAAAAIRQEHEMTHAVAKYLPLADKVAYLEERVDTLTMLLHNLLIELRQRGV